MKPNWKFRILHGLALVAVALFCLRCLEINILGGGFDVIAACVTVVTFFLIGVTCPVFDNPRTQP